MLLPISAFASVSQEDLLICRSYVLGSIERISGRYRCCSLHSVPFLISEISESFMFDTQTGRMACMCHRSHVFINNSLDEPFTQWAVFFFVGGPRWVVPCLILSPFVCAVSLPERLLYVRLLWSVLICLRLPQPRSISRRPRV